jgi:hypothetical protein
MLAISHLSGDWFFLTPSKVIPCYLHTVLTGFHSEYMLRVQSMLHAHVYAACPCPCCVSLSMRYVRVHAACLCQCCMFKSMSHGLGHAAMDLNRQHWHGHAAWKSTSSMDLDMQQHALGHAARTCTCSMNMDKYMQNVNLVYVHVACLCPCCTFMSMLHAQ